jgi:hypothetical protein
MQTHRLGFRAVFVYLVVLALAAAVQPAGGSAQDTEPQTVTITFEERNNSGASGTATLTAEGDQTLVEMDISGLVGEHPDHIHRSTCEDPEPNPLFPLSDVVLDRADESGHSETVVDVPLADLLAEPHVILIHKSMEEINVYVACADIVATGSGGSGQDDEATGIPRTGVGTMASPNDLGGPTQIGLLLAAAVLALAALRLGRWPRAWRQK